MILYYLKSIDISYKIDNYSSKQQSENISRSQKYLNTKASRNKLKNNSKIKKFESMRYLKTQSLSKHYQGKKTTLYLISL